MSSSQCSIRIVTDLIDSIVFSQWTSTLDLIGQHLDRKQMVFERIDGKTDITRRQEVLEEFEHGESFFILIMTTGVGAFG